MRSTLRLLAAAGLIMASAGAAFAAPMSSSSSSMGSSPPASGDKTSSPRTSDQAPSSSSPSASSPSADSAATAGANASATTGGFQVGEPVKDNTGATIGQIAALTPGSGGQTMAVIKMGSDSFQVATDRLGSSNGAATINLTQAQIASMVHSKAGASTSSGTSAGESTGGSSSSPTPK